MFVATVVAPRGGPPLGQAEVAALAARLGAGEADWLADGEAADLPMGAMPEDAEAVAEATRAEGRDLLIQPAAGRRKRLLVADMDSTLIRQECIDELAAVAGVGAAVAAITARAMNGEVGFEGALRERVALLAGLPEAAIAQVLAERITLMPGARELVATMRANGAHTLLVSGGFTAFAGPVAARLGIEEVRANRLLAAGGRLTGEVAEPILGRDAKVAALEEAARRMGIGPQDALAVGDGANDLGMLRLAGSGVALHAKPVVAAEARLRVDHADLAALLYLQGYRRGEFVA